MELQRENSDPLLVSEPNQEQPLRLGVVGGGEGAAKAMQALQNHPCVEVRAVACGKHELVGVAPASARCRDLADILLDPCIDAIYLATPNFTHVTLAQQCLERGKPVLIEKPLAVGVKAAEALRVDKGLVVGVALKKRFGDWISNFSHLFGSSRDGLHVKVQWNTPPPQTPWRFHFEESGGGALIDLGSHVLDLLEFLCGPVQWIEGEAVFDPEAPRIDLQFTLRVAFRAGAEAEVVLDRRCSAGSYRFEAVSRAVRLVHQRQPGGTDSVMLVSESRQVSRPSEPKEEYRGLFTAFWKAVRGRPNNLPVFQDGLRNLKLIEIAYAAANTGARKSINSHNGLSE